MSNESSEGISFSAFLFVVFLILKLTHVIDWSWYLVCLPLYGPFLVVGVAALLVFGSLPIIALFKR